MRKLILLAAGAAAAFWFARKHGDKPEEPTPAATSYAPAHESAAEAPATDAIVPEPEDEQVAEEASAQTVESEALDPASVDAGLDELRDDQPAGAPVGDAVVPDTSDDDPLVRQQENAARAEAGEIGGDPETVTADVDPADRPVVEGSGDAEETFETTEDQGR